MSKNPELEVMTEHVIESLAEINVILRAGDTKLAKKAIAGLIGLLKTDEPWTKQP